MSNYECYCAICSCPLASSSITIGRLSSPNGSPQHSEDSCYDNSDEDSDDASGYNPSFVNKTEAAWLDKFRCLGFNENAGKLGAAFISGPAKCVDDDEVVVTQGVDSKAPEDTTFSCYCDDSFNGWARVFPVHDACLSILAKNLTGSFDSNLIRKDILFEIMECLVSSNSALDIDYGSIVGPQQFWVSGRGEEYLIVNPMERLPRLDEDASRPTTRAAVRHPDNLSMSDHGSAIRAKNLFQQLPTEILMKIGLHVPKDSIASFTLISRSCLDLVRTNAFWKKHLTLRMAWAWEAVDRMMGIEDDKSFRDICLWLDHNSLPDNNQASEFFGIRNRRRIWNACEQLAEHYFTMIDQTDSPLRDQDSMASISSEETSLAGMCSRCNTEKLVWLQSWDDLNGSSATAEAVWDSDGILIGLGMIIRRKQSFAGKHHEQVGGSNRETCRINTRPWIKGMIAHFDPANGGIRGLTFMGSDRYSYTTLGNTDSSLHRLALVPENGYGLAGLILYFATASTKMIHVSLIQSPKADEDQITDRGLDEPQLHYPCFWSYRTGRLEINDPDAAPRGAVPKEIQSMTLIPLTKTRELDAEQSMPDLMPHEILLWSQDKAEAAALRGISIYAPRSKTGTERIIQGLRANFARGHATRTRLVGNFELGQWGAPLDLWPQEDLITLKIDGANGEDISQVAISPSTNPKSIKIRTNLDKEVIAGTYSGGDCEVFNITSEQVLAGLCLAFAPLSHSVHQGAMLHLWAIIREAKPETLFSGSHQYFVPG
ncbi:f-box domain protein [Fusarium beomiforme]|uniref:F-box domain protein n=1 Tax=Fusarium beomiforme TaxID=44412 RepID=A0A9P5AMB5_9HYPO|nr:f-box domain protein [Fusarium beomiforme]